MAENIRPVHAFYLSGDYALQNNFKPVSIGLTFGLGNYADMAKETTFFFDNVPTTTTVHYTSNVFSGSANVKIDLAQRFLITPYIRIDGGFQKFYSNIRIDDPHDDDACKPLEKKSIIKDISAFYGVGGGIKVDMSMISKHFISNEQFIDLSVSLINGQQLDYINTRKLQNPDINENVPDKGRPVNMHFINVNSNAIHEHQVAEVYTTPLHLLDIRLGYRISF